MTGDDSTTHDFGTQLRAKRERAGLAIRRAADAAEISEGRWRQLERGYQKTGDHKIGVNPKARTVAAVARAVGWDVDAALAAAGYDPATALGTADQAESDVVDLTNWHMLSGPQKIAVRQLVHVMADPSRNLDASPATVHPLGEESRSAGEAATVHEIGGSRQGHRS